MKKLVLWVLSLCFVGQLAAQESPWLLRGRWVRPSLTYTPNPGEFSMDHYAMPELDLSYFYSPNLALEVGLTAMKTQVVYRNGLSVGTFENLPPTLMAQYHVTRWQGFKPYLGVGLVYTASTTLQFDSPNFPVAVDPSRWGSGWQLGADIALHPSWSLNVDWKTARFNSHITTPLTSVDSRVTLRTVGLGLGYRF